MTGQKHGGRVQGGTAGTGPGPDHREGDEAKQPAASVIPDDPEQSASFIKAARELGCEENLGRLDEMIRRVAKARPAAPETAEPRPKRTPRERKEGRDG